MKFTITHLDLFERPVRLRLPFRFGSATVSETAQAFVRARIRLENGTQGEGGGAELLVPHWFDKSSALSDAESMGQLRESLLMAKDAYLAGEANTAFGHSIENYGPRIAIAALRGLNKLTA
jgi:hypothetical protein